jgi:hypothetical protein
MWEEGQVEGPQGTHGQSAPQEREKNREKANDQESVSSTFQA